MFKKLAFSFKTKFYPIKANINSKGEKIYHCPEGRLYYSVKPVDYFKNEEQAEKAGYRRSKI